MYKSREILRIVRAHGWTVHRVKGSHYLLRHSDKEGILIIPIYGSKTLGEGLVIRIFKEAGIEWKK